ncbi:MAG TPA: hypothetical protein VF768_12430 [Holophagaceae bacterium]
MKLALRALSLVAVPALCAPAFASANPGADYVTLVEKMADLATADKGSCDKMGADLEAFLKAHKAEIEADREAGQKQAPEERKAFREKYGSRLMAAQMKFRQAIGPCIQDPRVRAAIATLSRRR